MSSHTNIFVDIYNKKIWGDDGSQEYHGSSGGGGKIDYVKNEYIPYLQKYIRDNNIKSVVDLGCGKLYHGNLLYDNLDIKYYGYDLYKDVILSNINDYECKNRNARKYHFIVLDFYKSLETVINADLCIIKDVLQHWSLKEIYNFLDRLTICNKFKHILICNCNFQSIDNTDIKTGGFRPLHPMYYPLKKYNPTRLLKFNSKEIITIPNRIVNNNVVVSILAKNGEAVLPYYLKCIEAQTFPANKIHLYIRTNNNTDNTVNILKEWIKKVQDRYIDIYFDDSNVQEDISKYKNHEWNALRFKVLGRLRNESVEYARQKNCHYFIADIDNFIKPNLIEELLKTNMPVIGPLLGVPNHNYANFHHQTDEAGYLKSNSEYGMIRNQTIKGLIQVNTIHCTYLIRNNALQYVNYDDNSGKYEYVIFSNILRKFGIPQYIDNRKDYGWLTFASTTEELEKESRFKELN